MRHKHRLGGQSYYDKLKHMPYIPVFVPHSGSHGRNVTTEELAAALIVMNIVFVPVLVYQVFQYRKYLKAFKPSFAEQEPDGFALWASIDGGGIIPCLVFWFGAVADAMAVFALAVQLVLSLIR